MARDRSYPTIPSKKYQMSQDEIDAVREDAKNAKELLSNSFLKSYFNNSKQSILEIHAKQSIYDVEETTEKITENNRIATTHKIPAKKEYLMLAGEYRFIDRLLADLEQTIVICKEMEEKIKSEEIEIEEND